MTRVTESLARSQDGATDADRPPDADDPGLRPQRPAARDRGRLPDHEHRDRGRRHPPRAARPGPGVDDAVASARRAHRQGRQGRRRRSRADIDPYALASTDHRRRSRARSMLSRLYDDPTHMDRVVDHLVDARRDTARDPKEAPMTTSTRTDRGSRRRTAFAHDHLDRSGAHRASASRGLDGYERLAAIKRGDSRRRRPSRCSGSTLDELERGRTVFSRRGRRVAREPNGHDARRRRRDARRHRDGLRGLVDPSRRRGIHDPRAEAPTSCARSRRRPDVSTPKAGSCTAADASRPPKRASTTTTGTLYAHAKSTCLILTRNAMNDMNASTNDRRTTPTDRRPCASTTRVLTVRADHDRRRGAARRACSPACRPTACTSGSSPRSAEPPRAALLWLADVDHGRRDALVALDGDEIVAVARYDGRRRRPGGRRRPRSPSPSRTPGSTGAWAGAWPGGSRRWPATGATNLRGDHAPRQPGRARPGPQARSRRHGALVAAASTRPRCR